MKTPMMKKSTPLLLIALLGLVGIVAAVAVLVLSEDETTVPVAPNDEPGTPVVEDDGNTPLEVANMSDARKARARHNNQWPFGDFADDISKVLRPGRLEVMRARDDIERDLWETIAEHKLTLRLENVHLSEIVEFLAREFEPLGVRVYEGSPKISDRIVFDRVYLKDVTIQQVVSFLVLKSDDHVFSVVTPHGMCIGSGNAVVQARLEGKEWEADVRSGLRTEPDDFLDVEYRPDVRGATIGRLVQDILGKTKVEVVVGPRAWEKGVLFTWVDDPLPLREALDKIARRIGARVYVKDGRAFILIG